MTWVSFFIPPPGHYSDVTHSLYLFFEWETMFFWKDLIWSVFEQDEGRREELHNLSEKPGPKRETEFFQLQKKNW